jgi:hypothetical protein
MKVLLRRPVLRRYDVCYDATTLRRYDATTLRGVLPRHVHVGRGQVRVLQLRPEASSEFGSVGTLHERAVYPGKAGIKFQSVSF